MPSDATVTDGGQQTFSPGQLARDREEHDRNGEPERPLVVVIGYIKDDDGELKRADETAVPNTDETVAGFNTSYPADDPVVAVRFCDTLDNQVPDWREWIAELGETAELAQRIEQHLQEWRLPAKAYSYPESRLEPANTPYESDDAA